jgi:hypothetical protein
LWKLFRDLVGSGKLSLPNPRVKDYEAELAANWPAAEGTTTSQWVNQRLLPHYGWSDKLADHYADAYRSTYDFIYLAAAFAVFLALLPMAAGWEAGKDAGQALCVVAELVILLSIIGLLDWEKSRRWHRRWLAYRLFAELIRQLKCLLPLGGGPALPRIPDHQALFGDPGQTWMYWQLRAIARAKGIPAATVTPDYLGDCLDYLDTHVRGSDGQVVFHDRNQVRSEKLNHGLHMAAIWMFGRAAMAVFPYVPGKAQGMLKASAEGPGCLPSVLLQWGPIHPAASKTPQLEPVKDEGTAAPAAAPAEAKDSKPGHTKKSLLQKLHKSGQ